MFWRYGGYANISPINSLLDRPDVTVEEVLDESELMQELKQHNSKLIEYLREDAVLKRLFDYIISPTLLKNVDEDDGYEGGSSQEKATDDSLGKAASTEQNEGKGKDSRRLSGTINADFDSEELENAEKARLKYAYVASEVLCSPSWSIIEAMMQNEDSLRDFWRFLWRKAPLDSLQTSYFVKVNEVLLDQKTAEMVAFVMSMDGLIPVMLTHVDNPLVMDLLLKILSLDRIDEGLPITEWLYSHNVVPTFLSYISTEHSASTQASAGDFLKALITISANAAQGEQPCIGPNSLTRQLVSEPCIQTLISAMLQGGNPLTVAVGIIIDIIRKNNPDYDPEPTDGQDSPPTLSDPIYLGTLLRLFACRVPDLMEIILSPKCTVNEGGTYRIRDRSKLSTAWGGKTEPLGFDRFKTCELMAELLHCSNMGLHNEAGSDEYMRIRDAERERLRNQNASTRQDEDSGFVYTENANELGNGITPSALGSGSPEEIRRLDSGNTGEEDGFEDVGSSSILLDDTKGNVEETAEGDTKSAVGSFTNVPKLGMGDDLVDEPLTPPKNDAPGQNKPAEKGSPDPTSTAQHNDPISPSTSGLTDKVQSFNIAAEDKASPSPQQAPSTPLTAQTPPTPKKTAAEPSNRESPVPIPITTETSSQLKAEESTTVPETAKTEETPSQHQASTEPVTNVQDLTPSEKEQFGQQVQIDVNGLPVVGDFLKIMFYRHNVVPTILSFFFRFPWNNFLHNVVYDVVQQVLNGSMEHGFNRTLVLHLFESADITAQVVKGQKESDASEKNNKMRLGYMGHLTLVAEEVVKFTERQPPESLTPKIMEKVLHPDWINYVENTLSETRERDNAILGGVKPDLSVGHRQAVLNAINAGQGLGGGSSALANVGLNGGMGSSFDGLDFSNQTSASGGVLGYSGGGASLFSGFGSSSDDEDEDMEDPEDIAGHKGSRLGNEDGSNLDNVPSGNSSSQPIPILPSPPSGMPGGPSRARLQLAARLAAQKQAAENAAATNSSSEASENQGKAVGDNQGSRGDGDTSTLENESRERGSNPGGSFTSPFMLPGEGNTSSSPPPSFLPRFQPPSAYSSSSSSDGDDETMEAVQRNYRLPLEVYDDDEMGDMVGPHSGFGSSYSDDDEEDESIIRESLGYSSFLGPERYSGSGGSTGAGEVVHNDSDGDDDGLVEIVVPGRRLPST